MADFLLLYLHSSYPGGRKQPGREVDGPCLSLDTGYLVEGTFALQKRSQGH